VYSREVEGKTLEFGVSGKLVMNVLVMYDRQTESLWSQLLGEAIQGTYSGTKLGYLPAWQTTWQDWKERHPNTRALIKGYSGNRDPYMSYYSSDQAGVIGETTRDDRLRTKEFVIGVAIASEAAAYPFSVMSQHTIAHDEVGSIPILVVFDAENASGVVFSREVDDLLLTFEHESDLTLRDTQTGSMWDGLTGQALSGDLAGEQLSRVKSTSSFWFGWKDFYPGTRIYGVDG
jgi:hypothetical protein